MFNYKIVKREINSFTGEYCLSAPPPNDYKRLRVKMNKKNEILFNGNLTTLSSIDNKSFNYFNQMKKVFKSENELIFYFGKFNNETKPLSSN